MYAEVSEAYIGGLEDLAEADGDLSKVSSVASFFVSRVDTTVDAQLEEAILDGHPELNDLLGKAAIANAKLAYQAFQSTFSGDRFASLRERGARVQRPLWASTGTKSPAYSDVLYVESLIGPDTVNTMPEATLTAFLDHGRATETITQGCQGAQLSIKSLEQAGVSMNQVTGKLLADGVKAFADSYDKLLANIQDKTAELRAREHTSFCPSIIEVHSRQAYLVFVAARRTPRRYSAWPTKAYDLRWIPRSHWYRQPTASWSRFDRIRAPMTSASPWGLTTRGIEELQAAGVEPDVRELEGMDDAGAARSVVAQAQTGGRNGVGVIVLGRGEDEKRVHDWLAIGARTKGVIGFAVGRTVFWQPLVDYKDGGISRSEAVNRIAQTYRKLYTLFVDARSQAPAGERTAGGS